MMDGGSDVLVTQQAPNQPSPGGTQVWLAPALCAQHLPALLGLEPVALPSCGVAWWGLPCDCRLPHTPTHVAGLLPPVAFWEAVPGATCFSWKGAEPGVGWETLSVSERRWGSGQAGQGLLKGWEHSGQGWGEEGLPACGLGSWDMPADIGHVSSAFQPQFSSVKWAL